MTDGEALTRARCFNAIGFDGSHAVDLAGSWRQQRGTPVYTRDLGLYAARAAIDNAKPEATAAWRSVMKEHASCWPATFHGRPEPIVSGRDGLRP